MEHVIRYRILGHHPAASGKYYNTGFSGESLPVRQFLDEIVKEHQINLSAFRTALTLVTNNYSSSGGGGPPQTTAKVLYLDDHLHNYDSVDVTVSKRSLTDDAEAAEEERRAQTQHRMRDTEEQFHLLGTSFPSIGQGGSSTDDPFGAPPQQQQQRQVQQGQRHPGGAASSGPTATDALALQRAVALAGKVFPVKRGQVRDPESEAGVDKKKKNHVCVLCELTSFREVTTPCCGFTVCKACLESGQAMMLNEDECPVCGRNNNNSTGEATAAADRQKRRRLAKTQQHNTSDEKTAFGTGTTTTTTTTAGGGKGPSLSASKDEEGERRRGLEQHQHQQQQRHRLEAHHSLPARSSSSHLGSKSEAGDGEDARPVVLSAALVHVEEELRESLDKTLSFLDAPDPLTAEMKASRVKSSALAALDEAG